MKKNPYHWFFGIPEFNPAHYFVYLNDLVDGPRAGQEKYYGIYMAKQSLYGQAKSAVEGVIEQLSANTTISNALDFLKNIADNERNKELAVIKDYEKYLNELLPEKKDPEVAKLLSKINANILENPAEIEDFYLHLTKYINETRQSVQDYQARLKQFEEHNHSSMDELQKDDYRFRTVSDLQGTFTNLIGTATRAQKKGTLINEVRNATLKIIENSGLIGMLQSGVEVAAAFAVIQLDIEKKLQDILNASNAQDLTELKSEIDKIADNYLNANDKSMSKLQKAIINGDNEQLQMVLDAAQDILGISTIDSNISARQMQSDKRTALLSQEVSLRKQIKANIQNSESLLDELQLLKITSSLSDANSKNFHGNIFELIEVIQEGNTIKIRGNAGTDIIHLGSFNFDVIENPDVKNQLRKPFQQIENILTDYTKQIRANRLDDQTKKYQQMNKNINKEIKRMEELIKKLNLQIDNLFVYHESLKLYKSAETDESNSFHGRDLVILSYIDQLYAANGIAGLSLPDKTSLALLALNLSPQAVGGRSAQNALQTYLSIFAGLLMFDDVYNIAQEAENSIKNSQTSPGIVKQIHLYNLNGTYVPASMILTYTYTTMKQIAGAIEQGYAAKTQISVSNANEAISSYLAERPLPLKPQWTNLGEAVASGTTIRIAFLASFTQLMLNLKAI